MTYQYLGVPGSTWACFHALRLILTGGGYEFHFADHAARPSAATLVTKRNANPEETVVEHAFILWDWFVRFTVVPSGFATGYGGTAPHGLAYALLMLQAKDVPVHELEVDEAFFRRLNGNRLTDDDLQYIEGHGQLELVPWGEYVINWIPLKDPIGNGSLFDKYLPFMIAAHPRLDWEWLDSEIAEKCEKLAEIDLASALRKAFLILKSRLVQHYGVSDTLDGEDLVNKIFGKDGVLTAKATNKKEQEELLALRSVLSGLYGLFRNKYSHVDVEAPWTDAQTVLTVINFALARLQIMKSRHRLRAYENSMGELDPTGA